MSLALVWASVLTLADADAGALPRTPEAGAVSVSDSAVAAGAFSAAVDDSDAVVSRAACDFRALETRGLSLPSSTLSAGAAALRVPCAAVDPAGATSATASLFGGESTVLARGTALTACGIASGAAAGRVEARVAVGAVAAAAGPAVADDDGDDAGADFLEPKIRLNMPPLAGLLSGSSVGVAGSGAVSAATRRERTECAAGGDARVTGSGARARARLRSSLATAARAKDMASFAAAVGVSWSTAAVVLPTASEEDDVVVAASPTGTATETEGAAATAVVRVSSAPAPEADDGVSSMERAGSVELSLAAFHKKGGAMVE